MLGEKKILLYLRARRAFELYMYILQSHIVIQPNEKEIGRRGIDLWHSFASTRRPRQCLTSEAHLR